MKKLLLLLLTFAAMSCSKDSVGAQEPAPVEPGSAISNEGGAGVLTGSYSIGGTFSVDAEGISFNEDYAGTTAPGPVWYLSNSSRSIVGGLSLGSSQKSSGAHRIATTAAAEYDYLIMWCQPFSVYIGGGEIPE